MSTPSELFSPAVFKVGDIVQSIPVAAPGVHPRHSVAITGPIIELKSDGGWFYNISSMHHSQNTLWVPEHRVRPVSKSIFDDCYIEPRAGIQGQLRDERGRAKKWKRRFAEVNSEFPVLEGELSRLKKVKRVLEEKVDSLTSANACLSLELRETMPSAIFSRCTPLGKNAIQIRARLDSVITPLRTEIECYQEKINSFTKLTNIMRSDLQAKDRDIKQLTSEKRVCLREIKKLSSTVESLMADEALTGTREKSEEEEEEEETSLEEDLLIIQVMLTGVSSYAAAQMPNVTKSRNYVNRMRQRLGWFQEIINGFLIAECCRIIQIGHDNGSVNEAETLCVSIIITDANNESPRMLVLSASALPADKSAAATLGCIEYIFAGIKEKYV